MTGNTYTSHKPLVSIYWDFENMPNAKMAKFLLSFGELKGSVVSPKVYANWHYHKKSERILVPVGFECITVSNGVKNAVDFTLSIDCSSEASRSQYPHIFIIVTGDRYNEILAAKLQDKGKEVIIVAREDNPSKTLKTFSHQQFYTIDQLPMLIDLYKSAS